MSLFEDNKYDKSNWGKNATTTWKLLERATGIDAHVERLDAQERRKSLARVNAHPKAKRLYNKYRTKKYVARKAIVTNTLGNAIGGAIGGGLGAKLMGAPNRQAVKTAVVLGGALGTAGLVGSSVGTYLGNRLNNAMVNSKLFTPAERKKFYREQQQLRDVAAAKKANPKRLSNRIRFKFMREGVYEGVMDRAAKAFKGAAQGAKGQAKKARDFAKNPYAGEMLRRKVAGQTRSSLQGQRIAGAFAGGIYNMAKEGHYKRKYKKVKGNSAEAKAKRHALAVKIQKNRKKAVFHIGVGQSIGPMAHLAATLGHPQLRGSVGRTAKTVGAYAKNQVASYAVRVPPVRNKWQQGIRQGNIGKKGFDASGIPIVPRKNKTPYGGMLQATNEEYMTRQEIVEAILLEYGKFKVYGGKHGETVRELQQEPGGTNRHWRTDKPGYDPKITSSGSRGKTAKAELPRAAVEKPSTKWEKEIQRIMHGKKRKA